jgi:hypothetical protein
MWLSWLPGIIVFGAPSVAALPVNTGYAWVPLVTDAPHPVGLGWAWLVDVLVLVVSLVPMLAVSLRGPLREERSAGSARQPS